MAVEASNKPNMANQFDSDDDDGPVVFRRSGTVAKKNQLNTDVRKPNSNNHDGQSIRQIFDVSNGQKNIQKGKVFTSTKASSATIGASKASTSNLKTSPLRSPIANSKNSSLADKPRPLLEKKMPIDVKEGKSPIKNSSVDSDDEEDNKPLSARLNKNFNHSNKAIPNVVKKSSEDSDDDLPLSARLQRNSNVGTSGSKFDGTEEKKPLLKVQKAPQDGSSASIKQERPSAPSVKRPLDKINSVQSSVKKSKLSDSAASTKMKLVSPKPEINVDEEDEDDDVPIAKRMKSAASSDKSSSMKKSTTVTKVSKVGSTTFKKQDKKPKQSGKVGSTTFKKQGKKPKQSGKGSEYSKSTKLLPSSGDGQKKWTTLVHNGLIFPPPYQPHGIKMLYKGKSVDLTPAQEEVATMFAVMQDTDYMQKDKFKENFWSDWRKLLGRNHVIQNLKDCDFTPIYDWYQTEKEKKKQMTSEEKKALKEEKAKQEDKYMWAIVDGVKEKV